MNLSDSILSPVRLILVSVCIISYVSLAINCQPRSNELTLEQFASSVRKGSTAPDFVLVTVVDDNTKQRRTYCLVTDELLAAIEDQYDLPADNKGEERAIQIALSSSDLVFHFSRIRALSLVKPAYSKEIYSEVVSALSSHSNEELFAGFHFATSTPSTSLRDIYQLKQRMELRRAYMYATAHYLMERGFHPYRDCFSGSVILDGPSN